MHRRQDTEMGTITCKAIPSNSASNKCEKKQATITSYGDFSPSKNGKASTKDLDYEESGVFHGSDKDCKDDIHDAMFGLAATSSSFLNMNTLGAFDYELERALALSRGDIELKDVLEMSTTETATTSGTSTFEDQEMQLALARSKTEIVGGSTSIAKTVDEQLEEAIALSLAETKLPARVGGKVGEEAIEIDADETTKLRMKKKTSDTKSIIDVDTEPRNPSASHLPETKKEPEGIIEIVDDDDDDDSKSGTTENDQSGKKPTNGGEGKKPANDKEGNGQMSPTEKRRLAAEAAERRLKRKVD